MTTEPRRTASARERATAEARSGSSPLRLIVGLLALGGLVGILVWSGAIDGRKPKGRPEGPAARGATPKREDPRIRLAGRVTTANGAPVAGATVFVLPKSQRGGIRDALAHEVSNGAGRWTLRVRRVAEAWVGVVAPGFRCAWLDGDRLDPGRLVEHVVERAPAVRVRVVDATGAPVRGKGVQLEAWPPGKTWFLPGPRAREGEQWQVTNGEGLAVFRVGTPGAVVLTPHIEGRFAEQTAYWLPEPEGSLLIRVRPARSLHIQVMSADGRPVRDVLSADLSESESGRLALSVTDTPGDDGTLRMDGAIRPGVYDVTLSGAGWGSVTLPDVRLDEGPDPTRVRATLRRAPKPGRIALHLVGAGSGEGARRGRAPLVFVHRPKEPWARRGWLPGALESWDAETTTLVLDLEPGRYEVLVADVSSRRTALVRDVRVQPGGAETRRVPMRPGLRTSVNPVVGAKGRSQRVEIDVDEGPDLPVYGITSDGRVRVSNDRDVLARVAEGRGVYVGPYPVDAMTIRVRLWDGKTLEQRVGKK